MAQQLGITRLKNNMNIIVLQRKMYATFIFYDFPEHSAPIFKTFKILKLTWDYSVKYISAIFFTMMTSYHRESKIFSFKMNQSILIITEAGK